ncbi:elongation factor 2 [Artemisia annua]|uniref:Elongation factor 2 n=1 Tax=Artemisia annua TaxID=35608 RepID=A0A2U1NV24_ARTAN|nr:elongation factor 2 [Artemisia annua]
MTNKSKGHNCFYVEAKPLEDGLAEAIDDGHVDGLAEVIDDGQVVQGIADFLSEEFNWDKDLAMNIWGFGPETTGPNLLVDACKGEIGYSNEINQSLVAGFKEASNKGCLTEEEMRGICFNLLEDVVHCSSIDLRKSICYSQFTATPRLLEPFYLFEIQVPERQLGGVCTVVEERGGGVFLEMHIPGHPYYKVKGYIAINNSFGFSRVLKASTDDIALLQCLFDHWDIIEADPLDPSSPAGILVGEIRERKGLGMMNLLRDFLDNQGF